MAVRFSGTPVRLGIVTDIQFADKPDRTLDLIYGLPAMNEDGTKMPLAPMRYYSKSLPKARIAVENLNVSNVKATVHLGDIVDGNTTTEITLSDFQAVLSTLKPLKSPVLHVLGNHCLSVGRKQLAESLKLPSSDKAYYTYDLSSKWRIIVLDTVDVSVDRDPSHPFHNLAKQYMTDHEGEPNAKSWNGGLSTEQTDWLKGSLDKTRKDGMYAIVCGHIPVYKPEEFGPIPMHVIWNFQSIGAIFDQYADVVKAYFAGHFHQGSYVQRNGIHYVTFESVLDSKHDEGSWAVAHLFDDGIVIEGHGDMTSRQLAI